MGLPSSSFVAFLENHDQVANTGLGWRLFHFVSHARWRTMAMLLLAGPQPPLLFQGQEFASSRPFIYFADHEGEVGDAVRKGRLEFLAQFPALGTKAMRAAIGDPRDRDGFRNCKLQHEADRKAHEWSTRLHRDLLKLRHGDPVFSRLGTPEVAIESSAPSEDVVLVRYRSALGERLIVANLGADQVLPMNDALFAPVPGQAWQILWSSEEPNYGGGGTVAVAKGRWRLTGSSGLILTMVRVDPRGR
jgi:maltooligosyltrehalose trehalohydrolase